MLATAQVSFDSGTRTTTYLPKYRVNPPRKGNWWVRGYYELSLGSSSSSVPAAPTNLRIVPGSE